MIDGDHADHTFLVVDLLMMVIPKSRAVKSVGRGISMFDFGHNNFPNRIPCPSRRWRCERVAKVEQKDLFYRRRTQSLGMWGERERLLYAAYEKLPS